MPTQRRKEFWESKLMNARAYQHYYDNASQLAISTIKYRNMPETVNTNFAEKALYTYGMALFFDDTVMGPIILPFAPGGRLDVFGEPTERVAYGENGYRAQLSRDNSVIIYNDYAKRPTKPCIEYFARKLYDLDRTIDVNAKAQKTPVLLQCSEKQKLILKTLYAQYEGNEPFIFADKNLDINGLKSVRTDAPFVSPQVYDLKVKVWNEMLTYLGISNVSYQKKERMITDEVARNMGGTLANRNRRMGPREEAFEKINKMFGLNVKPYFDDSIDKYYEEGDGEDVYEDSGRDITE